MVIIRTKHMKTKSFLYLKTAWVTLVVLVLLLGGLAKASPVDVNTAREVGFKYMRNSHSTRMSSADALRHVDTYFTSQGTAAFYVFNATKGFVIVAADDCAHPVLGYSTEGRFGREGLPIQMEGYLNDLVMEIGYGIEHQLRGDAQIAEQWRSVLADGLLAPRRGLRNAVKPLLTETWNQNCGYNALCPEDENGPCGHAYAGCVATAMGQIMHYWGYPATGQGSHTYYPSGYDAQTADFGAATYNWTLMPDHLSAASTEEEIEAVATLLWHCGISVDMMYGADGSSAYFNNVPNALINYFKYDDQLYFNVRSDIETWLEEVKTTLDKGRPIFYGGQDTEGQGGHAFVCDGYDTDDLLHFNWGWSGYGNGYFVVDALNVGGYQFNDNNYAVFDIVPNCNDQYQITAVPSSSDFGMVNGAGSYGCYELCVLTAIPKDDNVFMYWKENNHIISRDATISFVVREDRSLTAVFATPDQMCSLVIQMYDSYGDGWNGNQLVLTTDDGCSENITMPASSNQSVTFPFLDGVAVTLSWIAGDYIEECSFDITFGNGMLVYHGESMYSGFSDSFTLNCADETVPFFISVTANPEEGGEVTGGGTFIYGETCTVIATPNDGYSFRYWTDNGEVVSTDAAYTFTVTGDTLVANFAAQSNVPGTINGVFGVGDNTVVLFSQGNLQYIGSAETPYWKFADNQWDCLDEYGQESDNPNVDRDLLGWGTSGYNHGAVCYQPWSTSQSSSDYYAYGSDTCNLNHQTGMADWGYNAISNGGNQEDSGWRVLTHEEWNYLFNTRSTASGIRYVKARVNKTNGVILLPDNWNAAYYTLSNTNSSGASYSSNFITATQWITMEHHGAVFLPAVDYRYETSVIGNGSGGFYWSASYANSEDAFSVYFYDSYLSTGSYRDRSCGQSVRLVRPSQGYSFVIDATPSPAEGGTVSGGGTYEAGAECTLTAMPSAGYTFVNWTENGEVVSTDATYTFVVKRDRSFVAHFQLQFTITATADPENGGVVSGAGDYLEGSICTLHAEPAEGFLFLNWTHNGNVVSNTKDYSFIVSEPGDYVAHFKLFGVFVGDSLTTKRNGFLPNANFYRYSLSQQIFTAAEIGMSGEITALSFFCTNNPSDRSRVLDVYMVHTDKTVFESNTDWISVTEEDRVFSQEVTFNADDRNTIVLDQPFQYNGEDNLAIIVDDNSGSWESTRFFRVFDTDGNQAIHIHSDNTNFDPFNPGEYNGTLMSVKNNIFFWIGSNEGTADQTFDLSPGWSWMSSYLECSDEMFTAMKDAIAANNSTAQIKNMTDGLLLNNGSWQGTAVSLTNEGMLMTYLENATEVTLTAASADPSEHPIILNPGWNWIGFISAEPMTLNEALAGIAPNNGDQIKDMSDVATYSGTWTGTLVILEPGNGYMYYNNGAAMTLVFPAAAKGVVRSIPVEKGRETRLLD